MFVDKTLVRWLLQNLPTLVFEQGLNSCSNLRDDWNIFQKTGNKFATLQTSRGLETSFLYRLEEIASTTWNTVASQNGHLTNSELVQLNRSWRNAKIKNCIVRGMHFPKKRCLGMHVIWQLFNLTCTNLLPWPHLRCLFMWETIYLNLIDNQQSLDWSPGPYSFLKSAFLKGWLFIFFISNAFSDCKA